MPILRKKWLDACGFTDFDPGKFATVCSEHFDKSSFTFNYRNDSKKPLRKDAVPCIFSQGHK